MERTQRVDDLRLVHVRLHCELTDTGRTPIAGKALVDANSDLLEPILGFWRCGRNV